MKAYNKFLLAAAVCSAMAALAHLGCILFGGDWYRFFGAGEQMAQMAEAGHIYPAVVTLVLVVVLTLWSLYALSGAGVILKLPLLKLGLCVIASIYLFRGLAFMLLMPMFPGNSMGFWVISSMICTMIGLLYAVGIKQTWTYLGGRNV